MPSLLQFVLGAILAVSIAILAWKLGSLSISGAWAASITGMFIFGLGGLSWAAVLLAFFISSSLVSRLFKTRKAALDEKFSKGTQRDWGQVFANGGLGIVLVLLYTVLNEQGWIWWAYAGAMAAVNADTWATELGVLSPHPPRLVTSGRAAEPGTSGAISLTGTLAAFGGALLIGIIASMFDGISGLGVIAAVTAVAGLVGSLFDSLLGATVQAIYYCPVCQKETERYPFHLCLTPTIHRRGWRWMNNDWVNFLCSLAGALVALGAWAFLH